MPPVKERRTRRSFSLHIPHSAAKTQRPPFRCSPRPSEVPRGRGQKREDYPAQEPGAAPEHLGQIVGKSGVNASARSVRGSRPRPARNKLSGAYAQALITRRSGSLHRAVFWAHPQRFSRHFSPEKFSAACARSPPPSCRDSTVTRQEVGGLYFASAHRAP